MHAEITRTDKPYRNELNQNCQQTLVFYTEVGQHDGSPESHEITFVDRVRFSQNKMYLLQNDISWGLERMSDHEI